MKTTLQIVALAIGVAALAGCASQAPMIASPAPATADSSAAVAKEFFAVLPETGRIHAFGDTKNYFDFLSHGEVTLTRTQIGAGPGGRTVVYGITSADVKANKPSAGELVMGGSLPAAADFYGEAFKSGRFYVFGDLKDMKDFIAFGEVPYSYTDIGSGPKGETLVYVMNKDSYKKGKPQARTDRFKSLRMAAK